MPKQRLHRRSLLIVAALLAAVAAIARPCAAGVTLTFDGLQNGEPIGNYFNGGTGGLGSGPGPNWGITFNGSNGVANAKMGAAVIVGGAVINVAAGFEAP